MCVFGVQPRIIAPILRVIVLLLLHRLLPELLPEVNAEDLVINSGRITSFATFASLRQRRTRRTCTVRCKHAQRELRTIVRPIRATTDANDLMEQSMEGSKDNHDIGPPVKVVSGQFTAEMFASSRCWGQQPLLVKSAFSNQNKGDDDDDDESPWPSWNDVLMMGYDEDAESRLITHEANDVTSFGMQVGPFEEDELNEVAEPFQNEKNDSLLRTTLVVNDVDRFFPGLADWMDEAFSFLPRWRRDDAQVSLANMGGGIGPHVDNYDVFLIQTSGTRTWEVGRRQWSIRHEMETLVPNMDVRILSGWREEHVSGNVETFVLEAGDMLYLPPRFAHCGTALVDGCMTLSIGCRAPNANDMISRLAEEMSIALDGKSVQRYQDSDLLDHHHTADRIATSFHPGEITQVAKERAKELVKQAFLEILESDDKWDDFFGRIVTEPKRIRDEYPVPLDGSNNDSSDHQHNWVAELGVWGDPEQAVQSVLEGTGALYQAEGIVFSYSHVLSPSPHYRLYVNGEVFEITTTSDEDYQCLQTIANVRRLTNETLIQNGSPLSQQIVNILETLVTKGLLYGSDE